MASLDSYAAKHCATGRVESPVELAVPTSLSSDRPARQSIWDQLCDADYDEQSPSPDAIHGGAAHSVRYDPLVSYLPILTGSLFARACYHSGTETVTVPAANLPALIDRIGMSGQQESEVLLRWRSNASPLDAGPNFEGSTFLSALEYHLDRRATQSPIRVETAIEQRLIASGMTVPRRYEGSSQFGRLRVYSRRVGITFSESEMAGTEEELDLAVPRMVIEGSEEVRSILERYEYIPTLLCLSHNEVDAIPRPAAMVRRRAGAGVPHRAEAAAKAYLALRFGFPFTDAWEVTGCLRFLLPASSFASMRDAVLSILCPQTWADDGARSPRRSRRPEATLCPAVRMQPGNCSGDAFLNAVKRYIERGADQYCFDMRYVGIPGKLYSRMEEALIPVLRIGKRLKERNFYLANHISLAWEYLYPFVDKFDRATATRLNELFLRGDLGLGSIFPSMHTASSAVLAEIYANLETRQFYYQAKLDGKLGKLFIIVNAVEGGRHQLSFFEAMALHGTMKRWDIDSAALAALYDAGLPKEKQVISIFDAENMDGEFFLFRTLVLANESYLARTEQESWEAIVSPLASALFGFLRMRGAMISYNFPKVLTKANFGELAMMFDEKINGQPIDGLVLTLTTAQYFSLRGDGYVKTHFKLKPAKRNTLDLLLKRVPVDMLVPHNIKIPKGVVAAYIAYTSGSIGIVMNVPRPDLRAGIWRMKHFPSLMRFERGTIPCEFITALLPTSHVAIVDDPSLPDFDDCIVECLLEGGWIRPLFQRESRTESYRSGAKTYGNGYRMAFSMLPAILDPITPELITDIQSNPRQYFDPLKNAIRVSYRDFLHGSATGKAVIYGKYLEPALSPRHASNGRYSGQSGHSIRQAGILASGTLVEIGCGRGSDIPRAYCAGGRTVFAIDPDLHALLQYEAKAGSLYMRYANTPHAAQMRKRMAIDEPIIFPAKSYSIPQNPAWSLRTIRGEITDNGSDADHVWQSLLNDSGFPSTGVAAIAIHFSIHYIVRNHAALRQLKALCDRILSPTGVVSMIYYDGQRIFDMFRGEAPPAPWKRIERDGRVALEIKHAGFEHLGQRKFYIEKRWADDRHSSGADAAGKNVYAGLGKKIAIMLPTISSDIREEYLVDPYQVVNTFLAGYQVVYDGPMLEEPSYLAALKESGFTSARSLLDCFAPDDYHYLSLIRITVLEKNAAGKRNGRAAHREGEHASQLFSLCSG